MEVFRLELGQTYKLQSGDLMLVVHERNDAFLGTILERPGQMPTPVWYMSNGNVISTSDDTLEVDPWDVKSIYREPREVFLLEKEGKLLSNSAFYDRETAVTTAVEKGCRIIVFLEVMDN